MNDVVINYYDRTKKGHSIACIQFRQELEQLIGSERVEVDVMSTAIYFRQTENGAKGLKLANGKIQLWSLADKVKYWEGQYPLVYDGMAQCYCIKKVDCEPIERVLPSALGRTINQPKKAKPKIEAEKVESLLGPKAQEETQSNSDVKKIFINNRSNDEFNKRRTTMYYLKDRVLKATLEGNMEESQILAKAYEIVSKDFEQCQQKQ